MPRMLSFKFETEFELRYTVCEKNWKNKISSSAVQIAIPSLERNVHLNIGCQVDQ